jgi:hypothetical protein
MKESYEVYVDEIKICTFRNRDSAHAYIKERHSIILPFLEYEPTGMGNLEVWQNAMTRIEIRRSAKGKMDLNKLLKEHLKSSGKEDIKERQQKEVNTQIVMPTTPRRTRIRGSNKKAVEGEIITRDGQQWMGKKGKDGKVRYTKYYEKNYETVGGVKEKTNTVSKRQAPKTPAKEFKEGTRKKGLDGKFWIVRRQKNGAMRWFKK